MDRKPPLLGRFPTGELGQGFFDPERGAEIGRHMHVCGVEWVIVRWVKCLGLRIGNAPTRWRGAILHKGRHLSLVRVGNGVLVERIRGWRERAAWCGHGESPRW